MFSIIPKIPAGVAEGEGDDKQCGGGPGDGVRANVVDYDFAECAGRRTADIYGR